MKPLILVALAHAGAIVPAGSRLHGLSADQVRRRLHNLEPVPAAPGRKAPPLTEVAIARVPVMFKINERVGVDPEIVPRLAPGVWADESGATLAEIAFAAKQAARDAARVAQEKADRVNEAAARIRRNADAAKTPPAA